MIHDVANMTLTQMSLISGLATNIKRISNVRHKP